MTVDFRALRLRLQESLERLEHRGRTTSEVEAVLLERSRQFAALRLEEQTRETLLDVIVVRRVQSVFGFPIRSVVEVRHATCTRVPHRSPFVCGVFQLRAELQCLVDVQPYIGPATELEHGGRSLALLVRGRAGVLGIRIDQVLGPRTLYIDELDTGRRDRHLEFVTHITQDCVEVVDVETLLASPCLRLDLDHSTRALREHHD